MNRRPTSPLEEVVPVRAEPRDDAEQVTQVLAGEPVTVEEHRDGWARILTAYDYPTAVFADRAGADVLLVGDSAAMTMLGHENTTSITMDEMLVFTRAVCRGAKRAFVVGDRVIAAMERRAAPGEFRSNIHRGGSAEQVKLTPEERSTAKRAAKTIGLAVAGVDMMRSHHGPVVLEVNSSPGLEGIEEATGIDVAGKVVEFLERRVGRPTRKSRIKARPASPSPRVARRRRYSRWDAAPSRSCIRACRNCRTMPLRRSKPRSYASSRNTERRSGNQSPSAN